MTLDTFSGPDLQPLLARARAAHGAQVLMIESRRLKQSDGAPVHQILVGDEEGMAEVRRRRYEPGYPLDRALPNPIVDRTGPLIVGLVGPTGAGKTTTLAKLATHPQVFGALRAAFISFDTYRIGAVEQLQTYAEIARIPCEVVYDPGEIERALYRLADRDVILVDTPGRSPKLEQDSREMMRWLEHLAPHELHLALPAGIHPALARQAIQWYRRFGVTHLLATKADEWPDDASLFGLAVASQLPMRWVTDGQEVPIDLHPAQGALLSALAFAPAETDSPRSCA